MRMKPILLTLCAFTFLVSCYQNERDCTYFKTGTFYSNIILNGEVTTSQFVRTNTMQIETYNGHTDSTTVRWINDCEMIFKTINPKNRAEKKDIHLKILNTTDTSYTFEYSYVGKVKKEKGIAYKLN